MVLALGLAGCDGLLGSGGERFELVSVDGRPLPASYLEHIDLIEGGLELRPDGGLTESRVLRCRSDLPPGVSCHLENGGRSSRRGGYSRSEGWVLFDDARFPATFEPGSVTILYGCPSGSGVYCPRISFRYQR